MTLYIEAGAWQVGFPIFLDRLAHKDHSEYAPGSGTHDNYQQHVAYLIECVDLGENMHVSGSKEVSEVP